MLEFKHISEAAQYEQAKSLFKAYAESMEYNTCFVTFEKELEEIESQYGAPQGGILLLYVDGEAVGCAGIRQYKTGVAELKRMYIQPDFRGKGRGRQLLRKSIDLAKTLGYSTIQLDTIPTTMPAAVKLYKELGFQKRTPTEEEELKDNEEVVYYALNI